VKVWVEELREGDPKERNIGHRREEHDACH
jgi:hypothetical protein